MIENRENDFHDMRNINELINNPSLLDIPCCVEDIAINYQVLFELDYQNRA